jgi:hypothetical protein
MPAPWPGSTVPDAFGLVFGFHVRGDSYGANRLADTLLLWYRPGFANEGAAYDAG